MARIEQRKCKRCGQRVRRRIGTGGVRSVWLHRVGSRRCGF